MPMPIENILRLYIDELKKLYGTDLRSVILYGSYARGDYTRESDIDLMVLVNLQEDEISRKGKRLSDITFDYNFDYDLEIMPIVKNQDHFNKWIQAYPFYNQVKKEGVELYAA